MWRTGKPLTFRERLSISSRNAKASRQKCLLTFPSANIQITYPPLSKFPVLSTTFLNCSSEIKFIISLQIFLMSKRSFTQHAKLPKSQNNQCDYCDDDNNPNYNNKSIQPALKKGFSFIFIIRHRI